MGDGGSPHRLGLALLLGPQLATRIHLRSRDVAMDVDPARHDHQARGIECARRTSRRIARRLDNLAVGDPQILGLAIDAISGIENVASGDEEVVHEVKGEGRRQRAEGRGRSSRGIVS